MKNSDLLRLLDNIKQEETPHSFDKNSRILLVDGLNLFFRNFAMLNIVNEHGVHVGGLGGLVVILVLVSLLWMKRKRQMVKKDIFARQGGAWDAKH